MFIFLAILVLSVQTFLVLKVVEDKETDCDDLVSVYSQQSSPWIRTEGDRQVVISSKLDLQTCSESARFEGKTQTVSKNMSNRASSSSAVLKTLLEEVRLAETKWKLGINIRHLLEGLLYSVHHSSGDQQYIHSAVDRFFDGVEMALKRTLTTSEDNWRKCEKLTVELQEVREDRRLALDRESIIQATVDSLRSELRTSRVEITGLKNMLEKSRQEKVTLSSLLDGRQNALAELQQRCEEQRHDVKRATDTIQTMLNDAQDDERVITQLVEELRILNCQKEELKRQLADRESEIAKLEGSLAGFVSEASTTSQYIKKLEAMKDDYQQKYVHFRRKAEKRENFLVEMEAIIKALLIRNDGLRYTNRKRQLKSGHCDIVGITETVQYGKEEVSAAHGR
ncbi:hypothetical protein AB6A40_009539 [Gnathostoma spinigerum]|uniref:Uncharacterized protein n=1 Tax=Gnathostoma spinigerum TaxID=75299 RepID=A0ABD6F1R6_9BILA